MGEPWTDPMQYLMLEDLATGDTKLVALDEATAILDVHAEEIEWALEEFGICSTLDHAVIDTRVAEEIAAIIAV